MSHTYRPLPPHRQRPRDGGALVCSLCGATVPALVVIGERAACVACLRTTTAAHTTPLSVVVPGVPAARAQTQARKERGG